MKNNFSNAEYSENEFGTTATKFKTSTGDNIIYPFGPPIFQTQIDKKFTQELIDEGRKLNIKENDHNFNLAGNLKTGRSYIYKNDYVKKVEPYLKHQVERFFQGLSEQYGKDYRGWKRLLQIEIGNCETKPGKLILDSLWINFMKQYDHNPPHSHTGVLSFVIFCKVPKKIFKVQADSNTKHAGNIIFKYGDRISKLMGSDYVIEPYENLMLLFPNELIHYVPSYWVDEERISVSGNFVVV